MRRQQVRSRHAQSDVHEGDDEDSEVHDEPSAGGLLVADYYMMMLMGATYDMEHA